MHFLRHLETGSVFSCWGNQALGPWPRMSWVSVCGLWSWRDLVLRKKQRWFWWEVGLLRLRRSVGISVRAWLPAFLYWCFFLSCRFIQNLSRAVKPLERGSMATYVRRTTPAACARDFHQSLQQDRAGLGLRQLPGWPGESVIMQTSSSHGEGMASFEPGMKTQPGCFLDFLMRRVVEYNRIKRGGGGNVDFVTSKH